MLSSSSHRLLKGVSQVRNNCLMVSSSSHRLLKGVSQVRNIEYRGAGMVWASSEVKFRKELGETKPEAR